MAPEKKIDLEAAKKFAKEGEATIQARNARWKQLFTASLEGVATTLLEEPEDDDFDDEDEDEYGTADEVAAADRAQRDEEEESWLKGRAEVAAEGAAALADAALAIEIERGLV